MLILTKLAFYDKHEIGKKYILDFRNCNRNQMMYQELSAKVDKASYNAAVNMSMTLYPKCNNIYSWDPLNVEKHKECTGQISASNPEIIGNLSLIHI